MREIKFRAWDKVFKRMILWEDIVPANPTLGDMLHDRYEWLEYTGLKDKNGIEIYEGDIVKEYRVKLYGTIEEMTDRTSVIRTVPVKWDDEELCVMVGDSRIGVYWCWCNLEVIGNIYENPELLEVK